MANNVSGLNVKHCWPARHQFIGFGRT